MRSGVSNGLPGLSGVDTVYVRCIECFCEKVEVGRIKVKELEDTHELNSGRDRSGRCASGFLRSARSSITAEMVSVVKVTTLLRYSVCRGPAEYVLWGLFAVNAERKSRGS